MRALSLFRVNKRILQPNSVGGISMEARNEHERIKEVGKEIANLSASNSLIEAMSVSLKSSIHILVKLESAMGFAQLVKMLEIEKTFRPFYGYLQLRQKLKKTDASYLHSNSLLNRACCILARELTKTNNEHIYYLLMSLDPILYYFPGRGNLSTLKLHEFILTDEGIPLGVREAFEIHEKAELNNMSSTLSLTEEQLIKTHSSEAKVYSEAIFLLKQHLNNHPDEAGPDDQEELLRQQLLQCKARLLAALASDKYQHTGSYGENGKNELINYILQSIPTVNELVSAMTNCLHNEEWNDFLSTIKKEDLFKLVLKIDMHSLKEQCKTPEEYKNAWLVKADAALLKLFKEPIQFENEKQLRAFMVCLINSYKIYRSEGPEYQTRLGYLTPSFLSSAVPKNTKIAVADVFIDFIAGNEPLTLSSLENYLKKKNMHDTCWTPLTYSSYCSNNIMANIVQMAFSEASKFSQEQEKKFDYT